MRKTILASAVLLVIALMASSAFASVTISSNGRSVTGPDLWSALRAFFGGGGGGSAITGAAVGGQDVFGCPTGIVFGNVLIDGASCTIEANIFGNLEIVGDSIVDIGSSFNGFDITVFGNTEATGASVVVNIGDNVQLNGNLIANGGAIVNFNGNAAGANVNGNVQLFAPSTIFATGTSFGNNVNGNIECEGFTIGGNALDWDATGDIDGTINGGYDKCA